MATTTTFKSYDAINRTPWLEGILGRDWKIAYFFILPMVLLMVGLIFWPFVIAIILSATVQNFKSSEIFGFGLGK